MTCGPRAPAPRQPLRYEELPAFLGLRTADLLALFSLHHGRYTQFRRRIAKPPILNDAQLRDVASYSRRRDPISYSE